MSFQVGQLRYTGKNCVTELTSVLSYQYTNLTNNETSIATNFKDVLVTPLNNSFEKDKSYYFYIAIPQDMNYDLNFNIKLVKKQNNQVQYYQFLRQLSVLRGGTAENVFNIALYETTNGKVLSMIPLEYQAGVTTQKDKLYIQRLDNNQVKFYLGTGSTAYLSTDKVNLSQIVASWRQSEDTNYSDFEIVFTPLEEGFTSILLELERSAEDYSIQHTTETGIEYGRYVDISKISKDKGQIKLYSVNNLIDTIRAGATLSRIGVNSCPGLLMAINGEEIRVGPSGYYECDVIPITSIGIVAGNNNYENNWTLDYTYDNEKVI
jgi:hypothetical protein